jgi:hypothetical protein
MNDVDNNRLQTNLALGSKDLSEEEYKEILADKAYASLSSKAKTINNSFHNG